MERNWTTVGEKYRQGDDQQRVEAAIDALRWEPREGDKPMMPALAIGEVIKQLRLPKVTQIAYSGPQGTVLSYPDGDDGMAYYQLLGIECNFSNGRCRVYVLDTGSGVTPLRSDFWPKAAVA